MHGATNNQQQQQHSKDNEKTQTHSTTHQRQGHIPHSKSQVLDDIDREASNVCEFMEDQLYFMWTPINPISTRRTTYLTIDNYLQYTAFFSDFGPFDIADVFRFCCLMKERHEMLLHDMTPEEAYAPVEYIHPAVASFRDAGCGPVTYTLSILDCLRGLRKGLDRGLLRLDKFNVKEYEHYERVSNGDFNWITPFFIAFAGPKDKMKREALLKHEAAREAAGTNTPSDEGSDETDTSSRYSFSSGRSSQSSVESSRSSTPSSTQSSVGSQLSTRTSSSSQSWRSSSSSGSQSASQMECPLSISMETSSIDSNSTITTTPPQQQQQEEQKRPNAEDSGAEIAQMTKVKKQRTRLNKSFRSVLSYFSTHNVQCIIRLNDKTYDKAHFTARGIEHVDMIYPDGTCPPWYIVERFFEVCERVAMDQGGVVAVHCMAGLGRTGTLIGAYLMRHFDMTARETIAFLRLMRPGSVVGPQQNWLAENEWRIRRREYQQRQPLQPQQQDERQKEIQDRLLMVQQSHGLTPESTKSSTTVSPAGSTIHTPGANYEQVFSRANSEGLESTWSEVADEVEGGSLTVLDDDDDEDGEDEAETSGFEDMSTTEDEIMEGNMGEDSDEDESDHGFDLDDTRHWSRPLSVQRSSPLRAQHTRQVSIGSLESLTPAFERDSVTDNGPDEDVLMGEAPDVEEPIMLKEHIGDTDYVIPGQPRKQDLSTLHYHHHHHHQNSRQPSSSSGGSRVHSDSHHQHKQHEEQQGDGNRNHHDDSSSGGEGKLYGKESFLRFSSESSSPSVMTSTLIEESTRSLSGLTGSSSNGQGQGTEGEVALAHVLETAVSGFTVGVGACITDWWDRDRDEEY
ncbi:Dual specificity protein phosphatase cdc14a [Mortierella sp. NVP41]|nr:Dual specificity protein phosphatase cdc14a [Mortierella sp. NVP41]